MRGETCEGILIWSIALVDRTVCTTSLSIGARIVSLVVQSAPLGSSDIISGLEDSVATAPCIRDMMVKCRFTPLVELPIATRFV